MNKLPIAAPSCVLPDTVAGNALFLASRVQEVGLCLFESEACLNYTDQDLPKELANLPLNWHVHLPVDLPWHLDGKRAAELALKVMGKVQYLKPRLAVLHPPATIDNNQDLQEKLLLSFAKTWYNQTQIPILLENIDGAPLANLNPKIFNNHHSPIGICLDVGHMLGFNQTEMLCQSALLKHVRLIHWSAPGKKDEHLALEHFSVKELAVVRELMHHLPHNICHMLEIFNWHGIEQSYPILKELWNYSHE